MAALKTTCTLEARSADSVQVKRAVSNIPSSPTRRSETTRRKFCVSVKTHRGRYTETRDFSLSSRPSLGYYTLARLCWITMVKKVLEERRIKRGGRGNEMWRLQREEAERQKVGIRGRRRWRDRKADKLCVPSRSGAVILTC